MTSSKHNGWANRATWNTALWLANDESNYRAMLEFFEGDEVTPDSARLFCHMIWPLMQTPDGFDLIDVNWSEVATMIEDSLQ